MENIIEIMKQFEMPIILVVSYIIGEIVKKWIKDVDNKYIPAIGAVVGIAMAFWINGTITPDVFVQGLVSGWAATGGYECINNLLKK